MSVISDTTVISNFATIGQLDILRALYDTLYVPTAVHEEIKRCVEDGQQFLARVEELLYPPAEQGWIRLTSVDGDEELRLLAGLPSTLHPGEAACLAIALRRGWLLLTDDRDARNHAARIGVRVSGSIGSLVVAVDRGTCTVEQANGWLAEMVRQGYRSPVSDLAPLAKRA